MTYTLSTPLSEAIDAVEKSGASQYAVDLFRAMSGLGDTFGDIADHQDAAFLAYWFAKHVIGGRFDDGEAIIAKNAWAANYYAEEVIRGRFEAGEAAIAKNARCAHRYSKLPGVPSDWREKV